MIFTATYTCEVTQLSLEEHHLDEPLACPLQYLNPAAVTPAHLQVLDLLSQLGKLLGQH